MTHPVVAFLSALPSDADAVALRDGSRWLVGVDPEAVITTSGAEGLACLEGLGDQFWAGWLAYDLGRAVERVAPRASDDLELPDVRLARFDARAVIDEHGGSVEVLGDGASRAVLERATSEMAGCAPPPPPGVRAWEAGIDQEEYEAGVRAIVELIRAGECYQVNFTRRLSSEDPVDPLALFAAAVEQNPAPHAAFVRAGGVSVVSASPECFLSQDGRLVETRPIKGTAADAGWLARSEKDRAENVMIVDLARNDLGRVCEYGSITVPALCEVERHPGLTHLVSTVRGVLRRDVGPRRLIEATFPAASITGAPKPRVMQAIEDLEPVRRGVYCGAVGWIDGAADRLALNVAIRTFTHVGTMTDGRTFLGVGSGIVADSDPRAEWLETELKVARLLEAAGIGHLVRA
ncbi:MAG: anthranilate synthase component I family protein [Actinobacteria bacterium]|nr:anthranilate synthase component I family protein [Actinomycetota bacterium]